MLAHHPAEALEAIGDDPKFFKQPTHMRALRDGMLGDESFSVLLEWAMAGKPGSAELIDSLRDAGVDEFIHQGVDVVDSLRRAHEASAIGAGVDR